MERGAKGPWTLASLVDMTSRFRRVPDRREEAGSARILCATDEACHFATSYVPELATLPGPITGAPREVIVLDSKYALQFNSCKTCRHESIRFD